MSAHMTVSCPNAALKPLIDRWMLFTVFSPVFLSKFFAKCDLIVAGIARKSYATQSPAFGPSQLKAR